MRTLLVVVALLFFIAPVRADALRCGERLVNVGDTTGQVLMKCGAPLSRDRRTDTTGDFTTVTIETWTYNLGPHDFIRILTFISDRLAHIEAGEYGT